MKPVASFALLDAFRHLYAAGGALSLQASLHGQLALIEWEEEKNRLLKMLLALLLGFACLQCVLLFAGGFVLASVWETAYRLPVAASLTVLGVFGMTTAWRRFQALSALSPQAFAVSREELAADVVLLKDSL